MRNVMPPIVPQPSREVISVERMSSPRMAKADLRKPENDGWKDNGRAIERARELSGLSLKLFSDAVGRDERQVRRWETAEERPQIETVFAAPALRQPLVIALAEQAGAGVEIETVVRIRRIA